MLKDIIDTLKDVIKNGKLSVTAQKSIQMEADKAQEIRKMFLEAIDRASENSNKKTATEGGVNFESKIKYSLSENASDDVKRILSDRSYEGEVKLRDNTPEIMLSQKGVKDLPMLMKASHIRENIFTESEAKSFGLKVDKNINYHGLGEELFMKIIDGLDSVTEAYRGTSNAENPSRRTNYFLLISSVEDSNGNKINVPVYINETSQYNRVFIDSNKIATVFGRKNLYDFLKKQVNSGNLVRVKKQSGKTSESKAPIARDYSNSAYSDSIYKNSENVNTQKIKRLLKDVEEVDIKYSRKYNKWNNAFSNALTADEWIKYNSAITTGVDAGLRINDHSMLVECESGDYSYKLVIYDNTFEEKPIKAVYGIGRDGSSQQFSSFDEKIIAEFIANLEDKYDVNKQILRRLLKAYSENVGYILRKYSSGSNRGYEFGREISKGKVGVREESFGGTVSSGTQKIGKQSLKDETDVETSSIIDTSSTRYILSEALKDATLILKHLYSSIRCF